MPDTLIEVLRPIFRAQDAAAEEMITLVSRLRRERDAALARVVELEALVSKPSGTAPPRDVDSETGKETDFMAKFGYGFQFREPSQ